MLGKELVSSNRSTLVIYHQQSIDNDNATSIDNRPIPKTTVSEKDKIDDEYLIQDEFGIFRDPDGYARAIDGRLTLTHQMGQKTSRSSGAELASRCPSQSRIRPRNKHPDEHPIACASMANHPGGTPIRRNLRYRRGQNLDDPPSPVPRERHSPGRLNGGQKNQEASRKNYMKEIVNPTLAARAWCSGPGVLGDFCVQAICAQLYGMIGGRRHVVEFDGSSYQGRSLGIYARDHGRCWGKILRYYSPPDPRQDPDLRVPVLGTLRIPSIGYPGIGSRNRLQFQEKENCR
ncbi:hypothetical protein DY000_02048816 [Brassica cretica]|uniref:Uncharacterized protein n=1 Tax=Brassica cretica TaxID=69181 RepID=A0ABQ7F630_BRACR|nr:hypothetical protein DY000_02048816 [Brassica cretica]